MQRYFVFTAGTDLGVTVNSVVKIRPPYTRRPRGARAAGTEGEEDCFGGEGWKSFETASARQDHRFKETDPRKEAHAH